MYFPSHESSYVVDEQHVDLQDALLLARSVGEAGSLLLEPSHPPH